MIKVLKKRQETTLNLLKRFKRKVKQSSNLIQFKKGRFKERKKSLLKKKQDVLKKKEKKEKLLHLYKLGKIDNPPR